METVALVFVEVEVFVVLVNFAEDEEATLVVLAEEEEATLLASLMTGATEAAELVIGVELAFDDDDDDTAAEEAALK